MKNLIDYASQDNGTDFRDALYSAIHDKVAAHIEAKKQEIASGLMGQNEAKEDREDEEHYRSRQAKDEKAVPSEESPEEKMARKKLNKEEYESLDEISTDLVNKYTDKAQKSYAAADTSPEKKANRRTGLMTGYRKLKATAKVPATYGEEVELDEMENRADHVKQFMDKTGLPKEHAEQYRAAVVKYPNNAMAGAEQAADRIAGPKVNVKFHQSPKTYQDKHVGHVKTMKGIMNPSTYGEEYMSEDTSVVGNTSVKGVKPGMGMSDAHDEVSTKHVLGGKHYTVHTGVDNDGDLHHSIVHHADDGKSSTIHSHHSFRDYDNSYNAHPSHGNKKVFNDDLHKKLFKDHEKAAEPKLNKILGHDED